MINFINECDFALESVGFSDEILTFLEKIKNDICGLREVELMLVESGRIRELNRDFLGRDYETDVLSFGLDFSGVNVPNPPLGSIVISLPKALEIAKIYNHSLKDEMAILFIHALLHLLGFDHESDNGEHREKESDILAHYGIQVGLIERNVE